MKRKQVYLSIFEAQMLYNRVWFKLDEQFAANDKDGDRAARRCVLASARAQLVRAFPELADERVEGKP